jgi:hypothetical protein
VAGWDTLEEGAGLTGCPTVHAVSYSILLNRARHGKITGSGSRLHVPWEPITIEDSEFYLKVISNKTVFRGIILQ